MISSIRIVSSALVLSLWATGCPPSVERGRPCPPDTREDPAKLAEVVTQLASVSPTGAPSPPSLPVCFGSTDAVGLRSRAIVLDAAADPSASAGRLGHLMLHLANGRPWTTDDPRPCAERLAQARTAETYGFARENEIRLQLDLPPLSKEATEAVIEGYRAMCPPRPPAATGH